MVQVCLALGTNLGNREANLARAIDALAPDIRLLKLSKVYTTAPKYVLDQPAFLNMAALAETDLSATSLLSYLKGVEDQLGRVKTVRFGPRLIDLDILFYDNQSLNSPDLEIPHPRMAERRFVLQPLADVAPDWQHPTLGKSVAQLLADLPNEAQSGAGPDVILHSESL